MCRGLFSLLVYCSLTRGQQFFSTRTPTPAPAHRFTANHRSAHLRARHGQRREGRHGPHPKLSKPTRQCWQMQPHPVWRSGGKARPIADSCCILLRWTGQCGDWAAGGPGRGVSGPREPGRRGRARGLLGRARKLFRCLGLSCSRHFCIIVYCAYLVVLVPYVSPYVI